MNNKKLTTCKACGTQIAKSAKSCPQCGAKNKQPTGLRIVFVVIVILMIIGALSGGDDEPTKVGEVSNAASSDVVSGTEETTEETIEETTEQEQTTFAVGEEVSLNDLVVTLLDVSQNSGSSFMTPSDGNVFVVCEFEIENNSQKDIAVSSMLSFEAYADDYSANISLTAMTSVDKSQLDGSIAAGKKMKGVVGYEIPKDWKELEIQFTPDFWSSKDITFVAQNG